MAGDADKKTAAEDITEMNRKHFDNEAPTYSTAHSRALALLTTLVQENLSFISPSTPGHPSVFLDPKEPSSATNITITTTTTDDTPNDKKQQQKQCKFLDYASGTGLLSKALLPHCSSVTGIDLSPAMVHEYNTIADNQGLSLEEMHAYVGDLLAPSAAASRSATSTNNAEADNNAENSLQDPRFFNFDVAGVALALHHMSDPALCIKRLGERVKSGGNGTVFVLDFAEHEAPQGWRGHSHSHGHGHHSHSHGGHSHDHSHSHAHTSPSQHDDHDEKPETAEEKVQEGQEGGQNWQQTVTHLGFSEPTMQRMFQDAGLGTDFAYKLLPRPVKFEGVQGSLERFVFIARATKG